MWIIFVYSGKIINSLDSGTLFILRGSVCPSSQISSLNLCSDRLRFQTLESNRHIVFDNTTVCTYHSPPHVGLISVSYSLSKSFPFILMFNPTFYTLFSCPISRRSIGSLNL